MDREVFEELEKISKKEEKDRLVEEAIRNIPVVGRIDPETGHAILPESEREDDDDFWTEMFLKKYGKI